MEITDQTIEELISKFDYNKALKVFNALNWKWRGEEITAEDIAKTIRELANKVRTDFIENPKDHEWSTGGITVGVYINPNDNENYMIAKLTAVWISIPF
jgi:hypothetical protein